MEGDCSALPVKRYRRSISIHALRVEGDPALFRLPISFPNFYPRPPGGGRRPRTRAAVYKDLFLSTPSGWRATCISHRLCTLCHNFYPRPPGGGRQLQNLCRCQLGNFYPRSPGGGRPEIDYVLNCMQRISIHALRVEGDKGLDTTVFVTSVFLSTPSGWRATSIWLNHGPNREISIHALRVEGDSSHHAPTIATSYFYPRPPGGGRRSGVVADLIGHSISIHALRVEGDSKNGQSFRLFLRKREKNLPL